MPYPTIVVGRAGADAPLLAVDAEQGHADAGCRLPALGVEHMG
jgi:hypothetical protein